ncbi:S-layer homology domain-containing protein [Nitriliruptor alkaliphilus]|uniref:S-layer homology domain-containing protein n=1 Tax=Nitriliruptor alkaliphilus TaxID=427918 RepID=UPI0006964637|nr:S-layer homology domain-containing protein [Nitriliruptor alkaliphilus]
MRRNAARRLSALTTSLLLTAGLLAPAAASAAPTASSAAVFGERGSAFADGPSARTSSNHPIVVRDLSDACPPGRVPPAGFTDVTSGYAFAGAIDCLVWYGITQGKTATTYAPGESVTRRQMAVFIHRMLDDLIVLPDPPARSRFNDVPATGEVGIAVNTLASDELAEMLGVRIVGGKTATTYAPNDRVTRAQMGSFIARTMEGVFHATGVEIIDRGRCDNVFSDEARIPQAHLANVKLLCAAGVVTGRTDGTYGPAADVNRGQMSAFLMRLMDIFVDDRVGITVPPDRFAEVHVDRGDGAAACSDAGRDGSSAEPFCTIQEGVDRAREMDGYVVDVMVRGRGWQRSYGGDVTLDSGSAFAVNLVNTALPTHVDEETAEDLVYVDGDLTITGADQRAYNAVYGVVLDGGSGTGVTVETPGTAEILVSGAFGHTGLAVDQTGRTLVVGSMVWGRDVGIDLIRTTLSGTGTDIQGSLIYEPFHEDAAFLRAPAGASGIDAILNGWRATNGFVSDDSYPDPAATKLETIDGRRAIVPA